jgi:hypothetical protein
MSLRKGFKVGRSRESSVGVLIVDDLEACDGMCVRCRNPKLHVPALATDKMELTNGSHFDHRRSLPAFLRCGQRT